MPIAIWVAVVLAGLILAGAAAIHLITAPWMEPVNKVIDALNGPVGYGVAIAVVILAVVFSVRTKPKSNPPGDPDEAGE